MVRVQFHIFTFILNHTLIVTISSVLLLSSASSSSPLSSSLVPFFHFPLIFIPPFYMRRNVYCIDQNAFTKGVHTHNEHTHIRITNKRTNEPNKKTTFNIKQMSIKPILASNPSVCVSVRLRLHTRLNFLDFFCSLVVVLFMHGDRLENQPFYY